MSPKEAKGACLSGDTSPDCIGIYKVPLDDEILPYISTAESLNRYAPGLRWVPPVEYPKTYREAKEELPGLREKCAGLDGLVLRGDLTAAGITVLDIIPRLTVGGSVMIQELQNAKRTSGSPDYSLRALRMEGALSELLVKLNQIDIQLGQALRGELGSLTVAQIEILPDVKEASTLFDDYFSAVPTDY